MSCRDRAFRVGGGVACVALVTCHSDRRCVGRVVVFAVVYLGGRVAVGGVAGPLSVVPGFSVIRRGGVLLR
jgi:hypothetical protein